MYKNFNPTADSGFSLKKQGIVSTIIFGGIFIGLTLFLFKLYFSSNDTNLLYFGLGFLFVCLLHFWRITRQFIVYPNQKIFKYSKGIGFGFQEFSFEEFDGSIEEKMKNMTGITLGTTFKYGFVKNGKYIEIILGQNVSSKKMRSINEEIKELMAMN